MKANQKIVLVLLLLFAIVMTYFILFETGPTYDADTVNELALQQMENTETSSSNIQMYTDVRNDFSVAPMLAVILVWCLPVVALILFIVGPFKKENY